MRVLETPAGEDTSPHVAAASRARRWRRHPALGDLAATVSFLGLAVLVLGRLWADPAGRVLSGNRDDHGFFMFVLAHAERVVFHLEDPFFTSRLNAPDGVNMMANTSILALGIPVSPVTHVFGAAVSVVLLLTLGLAGTAAAWYWVLRRHLVRSRAAAYVGAVWAGFAPTMISHANGHVNFTAQFLVPFIFWRVLRLREPGRAVRNGVALGLLITAQVFINEEVLLFSALACAVFVLAYGLLARGEVRSAVPPMLKGLGVAATTAVLLLAYPLWVQFFGPQHYRGLPFPPDEYVTDLAAYAAYARQSVAGNAALAERLSVSATEDNAFFGLPLLVVLVFGAVVTWRASVAVRAVTITGLVFAVISFGPTLVVGGFDTGVPMPLAFVSHLPLFNLITVTRFTMVSVWAAAFLLALASEKIVSGQARRESATGWARRPILYWWLAVVLALLPVTPKPLAAEPAPAVPAFIADGQWRSYVPEGRSLVPVPLPEVTYGRDGMRWASLIQLDAPVPRGYFMGPSSHEAEPMGAWRPPARRTSDILSQIVIDGGRPVVTDEDRRWARVDLEYWRAAILVLGTHPQEEILRATVTDLLGRQPSNLGGAWVWDVRDLPIAN